MKELKEQIYKYRFQMGLSIAQIEKLTKLDKSTIWRWLNKDETVNRNIMGKYPEILYKLEKEGLKSKIVKLLMIATFEKGKSRTISYYKIWQVYSEYLEKFGIKSCSAFYRFMDFFVKEEFGSLEKLEINRRPKEEKHKYRSSKGFIKRVPSTLEIDATGYTFQGDTYFILLVKELYSGYIFNPYILKAKEDTGAKFYNKAINSYDVAKLVIDIFKEYGLPKTIKTDNDKTMKNSFLFSAFKELGIDTKFSAPYSPQSKLIERTIRDVKAWIRIKDNESFEKILLSAINSYNNTEHNFTHISGKTIPSLFINSIDFKETNEQELIRAFSIRNERRVINKMITIDNNKYWFEHPDFDINSELGRNKEYPIVNIRQSILDNSFIEVYSKDYSYIGRAELISGNLSNLIETKQEKNKEKRIIKRKSKLNDELLKIEKAENQIIDIPTIDRSREFILNDIEEIEEVIEDKEKSFDPFVLFNFN